MWCHDQEKYCHEQQKDVCLLCRSVTAECGVTEISLENGQILKMRHGRVDEVTLSKADMSYQTKVRYADGHVHTFTGFAWGYCGEGPHGLVAWAHDNGLPEFINLDLVASLGNKKDGVVLHLVGLSTQRKE